MRNPPSPSDKYSEPLTAHSNHNTNSNHRATSLPLLSYREEFRRLDNCTLIEPLTTAPRAAPAARPFSCLTASPPTHSVDTTGPLQMNAVSASNQTLSSLFAASDRSPRFRAFCDPPSSPSPFPPDPSLSSTRKPPGKGLACTRWQRRAPYRPNLRVEYRSDRSQSRRQRAQG